MQPFLLELYGNPNAYTVAGLAAAIVAGRRSSAATRPPGPPLFRKRTSALILGTVASAVILALLGLDLLVRARTRPARRAGA